MKKTNKNYISVDELAELFLSREVSDALPEVDLEIQTLGLGFELKKLEFTGFRFHASVRGLFLSATILASLLASTGVLVHILFIQ